MPRSSSGNGSPRRSSELVGILGLCLLLLILILAIPRAAATELPVITEIRFAGNEITRPEILLQEMSVAVGDPAMPGAIAASRQAIMNLGLFRNVRTQLVPEADGAGVILQVTVEEKRYMLPLPRGDISIDGDFSYGVELRLDNLRGLNQSLEIGYEQEDEISGAEPTRRLFVDYDYPRIWQSPWDLGVSAEVRRRDLEFDGDGATTRYRHDDRSLGISLRRWLDAEGASAGWRAGGGLTLRDKAYDRLFGESDRWRDSQAVSATGSLEFREIHEHLFHRSGQAYGYQLTVGLPFLGSDYDYNRHLFHWRRYQPLGERGRNLNLRAQVGLAGGDLFGGRAYGLGGGKSLRGHDGINGGNAMFLLNAEYLSPFVRRLPQLRWVAFMDAGNVYKEVGDIDPTDVKLGYGVGLRWRLQTFVDVTLSADIAFGGESIEYYGSTSDTF